MKNTFIILLLGWLACVGAQQTASAAGSAVDLVQPGKDLVRADGTVIHVTKRDGSTIEGIQISKTWSSKLVITADTGLVQAEKDPNKVRLIMYNAKIKVTLLGGGVKTMTDPKLNMVF
jgi:uncharacterized protein GlcG (DUF336 family)